jgi:7-alpha-hydroxysteroid dehydrogenase
MLIDRLLHLDQDVAIVTGAAAGIGRAIAETFAEAGAAVVVTDLKPEGAIQVADAIVAAGGRAVGIECNVTDEAHLARAVEQAVSQFGKLTILVNNAGGGGPKPFDMPMKDFRWAYELNVFALFRLMQLAAPHMETAGGGAILNISSMSGENKNQRMASYGSSKAAVNHLTRNAAFDLGPKRIRRAEERADAGNREGDAEAHAARPARTAFGYRQRRAVSLLAGGGLDQRPGADRLGRRRAGTRLIESSTETAKPGRVRAARRR